MDVTQRESPTRKAVLSNREDAIPMLRISDDDIEDKPNEPDTAKPRAAGHARSTSIQERLFTSLFERMLPTQEVPQKDTEKQTTDKKVTATTVKVEKPNFSLPLMSTNFRRFNARIGVVFVFQHKLIQLFSWKTPSHTLSFMALYGFCCLNPNLFTVVPLAICLFFIMVPAFIQRHPPPPATHPLELFSASGPASAPAANIKPAPEMSKDFFRNMRDLQNSMEDFSVVHDQLISVLAPLTNFADERLSSAVFLFLTLTTCALFIFSNLLPYRTIFLLSGWSAMASGHPALTKLISKGFRRELLNHLRSASDQAQAWIASDILLDEPPEIRQVEVFELQRHRPGSFISPSPALSPPISPRISSSPPNTTYFSPRPSTRTPGSPSTLVASDDLDTPHSSSAFARSRNPLPYIFEDMEAQWESFLYTPVPFAPLSPARIAGDRPHGAAFFEDVLAPRGWEWADKKWRLDVLGREWVEERMITGVEVEVSGGEFSPVEELGGWVYDIGGKEGEQAGRSDKRWSREAKTADWEEGTGTGPKGQWRRRRWVRRVRRKGMKKDMPREKKG